MIDCHTTLADENSIETWIQQLKELNHPMLAEFMRRCPEEDAVKIAAISPIVSCDIRDDSRIDNMMLQLLDAHYPVVEFKSRMKMQSGLREYYRVNLVAVHDGCSKVWFLTEEDRTMAVLLFSPD